MNTRPPDSSTTTGKILLAIVLVVTIVAGYFIAAIMFDLPRAGATTGQDQTDEACHLEVTEHQWTRATSITEHQLSKHTRTREQTVIDGWQRYSFTGYWLSDTIPPPGPAVWPWAWQANTASDPHGVGVEGAYYQSSGNSGNGDWFWLEATETPGGWGPWSDPTPWGDGLVDETWVTEIPEPVWTPHGSGPGWERQRAQLPTLATRQIDGPDEVTGWQTDPPEGDGWEITDTRTIEGDEIPCPTATATPGTCEDLGEVTVNAGDHYTAEITGPDDARVVTFTASGTAQPATIEAGPFDVTANPSDPECAPPPTTWTDEATTIDCDTATVTTVTTSWSNTPVWSDELGAWTPGEDVVTGAASSVRQATGGECPECDGTGDGIPEHGYDDPTDGICAEEEPPPAPEPPIVDPPAPAPEPTPAAMTTLPETGTNTDRVRDAGIGLATIGAALLALEALDRRRKRRTA